MVSNDLFQAGITPLIDRRFYIRLELVELALAPCCKRLEGGSSYAAQHDFIHVMYITGGEWGSQWNGEIVRLFLVQQNSQVISKNLGRIFRLPSYRKLPGGFVPAKSYNSNLDELGYEFFALWRRSNSR